MGSRLLVALNGMPCVDHEDASGPRQGIVALQLDGPSTEVRLRNLQLEVQPKAELSTVKR